MIVLGVDPGFASMGWAALVLTRDSERVLDMGIIRTAKSAKKRAVLATEDNLRRIREIADELDSIVGRYPMAAIAAESQSWPRSASASAKVGMAWGVLGALSAIACAPLVQASPQQVKQAVTGRKNASKGDVIDALVDRYGIEQLRPLLALPKTQQEHLADALAAAVACLDSEVLRGMRRLCPERPEWQEASGAA